MRAQAFDTMTIVISVIVAIAILGTLLTLTSNANPEANDPLTIMKNGLKTVVAEGYGITLPQKAVFTDGTQIVARAVIGTNPITENELAFYCGNNALCGSTNSPLQVKNDAVTAQNNAEAFITICGNDNRVQNPKYCITIGRTGAESRDTCTQKCLNQPPKSTTTLTPTSTPKPTASPSPTPTSTPSPSPTPALTPSSTPIPCLNESQTCAILPFNTPCCSSQKLVCLPVSFWPLPPTTECKPLGFVMPTPTPNPTPSPSPTTIPIDNKPTYFLYKTYTGTNRDQAFLVYIVGTFDHADVGNTLIWVTERNATSYNFQVVPKESIIMPVDFNRSEFTQNTDGMVYEFYLNSNAYTTLFTVGDLNTTHLYNAQKLSNNTYLLSEPELHRVVEINGDKKMIWKYDLPTDPISGQQLTPAFALRLSTGNTLIGNVEKGIDIVQPDGSILQSFPGYYKMTDAQELTNAQGSPNGDVLVTANGKVYQINLQINNIRTNPTIVDIQGEPESNNKFTSSAQRLRSGDEVFGNTLLVQTILNDPIYKSEIVEISSKHIIDTSTKSSNTFIYAKKEEGNETLAPSMNQTPTPTPHTISPGDIFYLIPNVDATYSSNTNSNPEDHSVILIAHDFSTQNQWDMEHWHLYTNNYTNWYSIVGPGLRTSISDPYHTNFQLNSDGTVITTLNGQVIETHYGTPPSHIIFSTQDLNNTGLYNAQKLSKDSYLISEPMLHRVIEITTDKKIIWEYDLPKDPATQQPLTPQYALRLSNGNTLIGNVEKSIDIIQPDGSVSRTIPGYANLTDAQELPNGNLLITAAGSVQELDPNNKVVWDYTNTEIISANGMEFTLLSGYSAQRLSNGNTLITGSWTGIHRYLNAFAYFMVEVKSDKSLKWYFEYPQWAYEVDSDSTHSPSLVGNVVPIGTTIPSPIINPLESPTSTVTPNPIVTPNPSSVLIPYTPTPMATIDPLTYQHNPIPRTFTFMLNGKTGSIPFSVYAGLNSSLSGMHTGLTYNPLTQYPPTERDYILRDLNEPDQAPFLQQLSDQIRAQATNPDDAARNAISLVQNIPFDYTSAALSSATGKYPYETLATDTGVCQEKSELLAALLRDLGFGTAIFRYESQSHEVTGIQCPMQYSYLNSGYCFIETTAPTIPTYSNGTYGNGEKLTTTPQTIIINNGRSMDSISQEYADAQEYDRISQTGISNGMKLSAQDYAELQALMAKYGMKSTS